jgi:hypothetical protein
MSLYLPYCRGLIHGIYSKVPDHWWVIICWYLIYWSSFFPLSFFLGVGIDMEGLAVGAMGVIAGPQGLVSLCPPCGSKVAVWAREVDWWSAGSLSLYLLFGFMGACGFMGALKVAMGAVWGWIIIWIWVVSTPPSILVHGGFGGSHGGCVRLDHHLNLGGVHSAFYFGSWGLWRWLCHLQIILCFWPFFTMDTLCSLVVDW